MAFRIVRNDITKVKTDAIVNTADPEPVYAEGTDKAIYEAAGAEMLLAERARIGRLKIGMAAPTPAFALPARYVIHTVGPEWIDGESGELDDLRNCYKNSLEVAEELNCKSVTFPLIATGGHGFPKEKALKVAVEVFREYLSDHDMKITLVVYNSDNFVLSGDIFEEIKTYMEKKTKEGQELEMKIAAGEKVETAGDADEECKKECKKEAPKSWQDTIFWWMEKKGLTEAEVIQRANVGRSFFERLKSESGYEPKKFTIIAFAIALELSLSEAKDLLKKAGFTLSFINKFDLIVQYFFEYGVHDIYVANLALFDHKQPLLGE